MFRPNYHLDCRVKFRLKLTKLRLKLKLKFTIFGLGWLKLEVKLLLSANRKSYIQRRLAQQRMTLSDLEWPFRFMVRRCASRAISAVDEFLAVHSVTHCVVLQLSQGVHSAS